MSYPITEKLISNNVSNEWLDPIGVVIHETATPNAPVFPNEFNYFDKQYRGASAHYFIDYQAIGRFIPENRVAWHAGYKANHRYLSIEMCHYTDPVKFKAVWDRTVWLTADMFYRYGWQIDPSKTLVTHEWVTKNLGGTTHVDPTAYLKMHGKTFSDFVAAVKLALAARQAPVAPKPVASPETPVAVYVQGIKVSDKGILVNGRTIVPVKDVVAAYGVAMTFDNVKKQAVVQGEHLESTELRNNVSFAWARDVADAMRAEVQYDGLTKTIAFT